jgi:hypothetical protein
VAYFKIVYRLLCEEVEGISEHNIEEKKAVQT